MGQGFFHVLSGQQAHERLCGSLCGGGANLCPQAIKQGEEEAHEGVKDVKVMEVDGEE